MPRNRTGLTADIRRFASAHPQGVSTKQLREQFSNVDSDKVRGLLRQAVNNGRMFSVSTGSNGVNVWFVDLKAAQEYAARTGHTLRAVIKDRRAVRAKQDTGTLFTPPKAKVQGPAHIPGSLRTTAQTKHTYVPAPKGRFDVEHAPRVIDSRECRPWALAATNRGDRA